MALCLATSLLECNGFDAADQMHRYCQWMDEGYLSSTSDCFDIGVMVADALHRFQRVRLAVAKQSGNLMGSSAFSVRYGG